MAQTICVTEMDSDAGRVLHCTRLPQGLDARFGLKFKTQPTRVSLIHPASNALRSLSIRNR